MLYDELRTKRHILEAFQELGIQNYYTIFLIYMNLKFMVIINSATKRVLILILKYIKNYLEQEEYYELV